MRRKMDPEGYLPVTLIASFNRVQAYTNDLSLVVEAITNSDKLELSNGFKVRTKHEPSRWPILDKGALGQPPLKIGPLTATMKDLAVENLNPDVAEFVPNNKKGGTEKKDGVEDDKGSEEEKSWREVKRKTKENKGKKEAKVKSFEREELEFHFDEELDQEVPTGRQNTFTTEW